MEEVQKSKIFKTETFINSEDNNITIFTEVDNESNKRFVGIIQIPIQTPRGVAVQPVPHEITGVTTIQEAFDKLPSIIDSAIEKIEAELNKPKLVVPGNTARLKITE